MSDLEVTRSALEGAHAEFKDARGELDGLGGLFDRHGAEAVTRRTVYVGSARRGPDTDVAEPTFVWSERDASGVRVKVALTASEDDSFHALLAPFTLV